jgi:hypothetical protein
VGFSPCKVQNPQAEARATETRATDPRSNYFKSG